MLANVICSRRWILFHFRRLFCFHFVAWRDVVSFRQMISTFRPQHWERQQHTVSFCVAACVLHTTHVRVLLYLIAFYLIQSDQRAFNLLVSSIFIRTQTESHFIECCMTRARAREGGRGRARQILQMEMAERYWETTGKTANMNIYARIFFFFFFFEFMCVCVCEYCTRALHKLIKCDT